ncbi:zinc ABC transporter permease subunit ZnuB [Endozoicomonas sp. SCSIO W0465]|uniref:zinc ABC transporter permease subunit ZnuB n=1 Tax=Endozoicomonas sp. SCSIO W0465 TaxID=2918516 RepID=UPI002074CB1A|nr:zinc ABC transporter permease subunit ZnuB [Endozoicomonas sp. SCSIO W0465]USE39879.1 zinc ABC transporter permease subunit ZnuB [Endozoicomonas sp. SCSIO W0465]
MSDILLYALLAGYGVALLAAPLGCFVVWRRMAYFGDTLSHSALLGVSLGLMLDININLAVIISSLMVAAILVSFQEKQRMASDTLLGILAHSSLSIGLVAVSFADNVRVDMMSYLFGDLLATGTSDLYWIYGGGALVLAMLVWLWKPLLSMSVHAELAQVEGIPVRKLRMTLTLLMALVIAVAMKIVGVLLITSLMIIPAATAQRLARTPEQMVVFSALLGILGVSGGLTASWYVDTPAGPSVVVASFSLFLITRLIKRQ